MFHFHGGLLHMLTPPSASNVAAVLPSTCLVEHATLLLPRMLLDLVSFCSSYLFLHHMCLVRFHRGYHPRITTTTINVLIDNAFESNYIPHSLNLISQQKGLRVYLTGKVTTSKV
jgi:hypothetical protein